MVRNTMATPYGPAMKVAGNSPGRMSGRHYSSVIVDELEPKNPWRKYQLKLMPKKINGKWYKPGDWVYRRRINNGYANVGEWAKYEYGDHFDYMRGK